MNKYGFTDKEWNETLSILKKHKEIEKIVLFGSRAKNTFKPMSDVDIVLYGEKISHSIIAGLQSDFEDSQIPYFFDIIACKTISSNELKEHIRIYGKTILGGENGVHSVHSVHSVQDNINSGTFERLKFLPPPLQKQKAAAAVIASFDDKIELLQAQNKTLETTAQTIFKKWFGKYQIGDELPVGWRFGKLKCISEHIKMNIKPFNFPEREYFHYSLPAFDDGLRPIKEKGINIKSNKYSVIDDTFLVSTLNSCTPKIWTIYKVDDNSICSTEFQVVQPNDYLYFSLIHSFLNSQYFTAELFQKVQGTSSSYQRVKPQDIFDVNLIIPENEDLSKFDKLTLPLILKKGINHNQIKTLEQIRKV